MLSPPKSSSCQTYSGWRIGKKHVSGVETLGSGIVDNDNEAIRPLIVPDDRDASADIDALGGLSPSIPVVVSLFRCAPSSRLN